MDIREKEVVRSEFYYTDIQDIFEYGEVTFGFKAAIYYIDDLKIMVRDLNAHYLLHPECRHLETKTKIYRNIILGSYLIIYRITPNRIEVLRAFHGSRSPKIIAQTRSLKI